MNGTRSAIEPARPDWNQVRASSRESLLKMRADALLAGDAAEQSGDRAAATEARHLVQRLQRLIVESGFEV